MTLARPIQKRPQTQPHPSGTAPLMAPVPTDGGRLRRCTFRRVTVVQGAKGRELPLYEVACLYPDREQALPLGDLASARAICDACAATGIFRPDED
ncbi:MAG: hypothetical protein QOH61_1608 [Chloroflexota bacterium]|nr:hypothetical protein [Chloroflexota bacterium]